MNATLNKRERRAQQLLRHYETCERLVAYLDEHHATQPPASTDGKKISVALLKAERIGAKRALNLCNDSRYSQNHSDTDKARCGMLVKIALGCVPPGFFLNGDPRGYALKIDNENAEGKALIDAVKLHTDWGGYGILSPEITGD